VTFLATSASGLAGALPLAATLGEAWMVGYLLIKGMPERAPVPGRRAPEAAPE
jgi:hypothetical protein